MESNITALSSFSWKDVNWEVLRSLRSRFLSFEGQERQAADYWQSVEELACYDLTFAERIGWKWDAVLAELHARGWTLPKGTVLDFGCGTGVAGRRVVSAWPDRVSQLKLWDRSSAAMQFARNRARAVFPQLSVEAFKEGEEVGILVVSHVLNELSPGALDRLLSLASRAQVVLWVEPGTVAVSHALVGVRQRLILLKQEKDAQMPPLRPVAPCPHALSCGMLTPGNERHWCHHFAKVPSVVFQDGDWSRFARMLEVDLGTVPFSYLVLDRRPVGEQFRQGNNLQSGNARVIGSPRCYKGFHKVLGCQAEGVRELVLQKRDAPELFKEMKKDPGSLYQWDCQKDKITGGERIY